MSGFSPLRFSIYASDLSQAIDRLARERQAEMLDREKLGIRSRIIGSEQYVTHGDKTVMVSPMASDQDIATALNLGKIDGATGNGASTLPVTPISKPLPAAGGFTPGSLKALLQGIRTRQQAVMGGAVEKAQALNAALDQVEKVTGSIEATTDSILSEIGQFSNMPPEGES